MITTDQIMLIHIAARKTGLIDSDSFAGRYRLLLRNVAGVESSKQLNNSTFENVMAVMEDIAGDDPKKQWTRDKQPSTYFRQKVKLRGVFANDRLIYKIHALAAGQQYDLAALCHRMSNHRTDKAQDLNDAEAHNLIEALKAIVERGEFEDKTGEQRETGSMKQ